MTSQQKNMAKVSMAFPILLALYEMATYLSNDAYLPAMPHIARDLQTSHHLVQLTLTAWFMGAASIQLILGPVCDRLGRRPVLLFGGLLFILTAIGCATATSIHALLILRFAQGATIASMGVAGYATIHDLYDREKAIHMIAMMNSITVLAPAFGPLFGAIILHFTNWRMIFVLLAIWAFAAIAGLQFKMPETRQDHQVETSLRIILRQYKNMLINKRFLLYMLISRALFAAMIAWIAAGPFLLIDHFHFSSLAFGLAQVFIFGSFILGARTVKHATHRFTLKAIIRFGVITVFVASCYALLSSLFYPQVIWNMIAAMIFIAGASGLIFPILGRLAVEASDEPMGSKVAMTAFLMGAAGIVGSAVISFTYDGTLSSLGMIIFTFSLLAAIFQFANRHVSGS